MADQPHARADSTPNTSQATQTVIVSQEKKKTQIILECMGEQLWEELERDEHAPIYCIKLPKNTL